MAAMDRVELTGIAAVSGTAREVAGKLAEGTNQQVVAFTLPRASGQQRDAIASTLETLVKMTSGQLIRRDEEALETLVRLFLPAITEPQSTLREAAMIAKARATVLESAEWLTAAQVAELAGLSAANPNAQTTRWKKEERIFSVKQPGCVELFPAYGLDPESGFRPSPALAEVIKILKGRKDGWGLAYWFASINGFLGGKRPQDVLAIAPHEVIAAARDEAEGVVHG
jgi:hypothetical protein